MVFNVVGSAHPLTVSNAVTNIIQPLGAVGRIGADAGGRAVFAEDFAHDAAPFACRDACFGGGNGWFHHVRAGARRLLLKPQTFMNESGRSMAAAMKFFKIPPERAIVFYDELDIAPGKLKVKQGGGAAGHNGIRSAIAHLSSPEFWRVRIGIGHPGDKKRVSGYVLSDFAKADQVWLERMVPAIADHSGLLIEGNECDFMTRVIEETK
mgnify:CR=1 FL=1